MQNHVIDPTYFYDAIEQFAFNYEWFVENGNKLDDYGRLISSFDKKTIRGSLQSQGVKLRQSKEGNTEEMIYEFYCKSIYRISIGDFIKYKNRYLHVESVNDYDEWGVRSCSLKMVQLSNYKDFEEYLKYLDGEIIV